MIINIGRQLGSGGREIGEKLAVALGYSYFDKELISIAAEKSGFNAKFFEKADEDVPKSISGNFLGMPFHFTGAGNAFSSGLTNEALFQIQSEVIQGLAQKQSSVFVGRCADYILRERTDCLNIFICANVNDRIKRICNIHEESENKAKERLEKIDKQRAEYYEFYSGKVWGKAESYHVCINSSVLGIDGTVNFLLELIQKTK